MTAVMGHAAAYKSADESQVTNAVLADDSALSVAVGSGETWEFDIRGFLTTADANPDIQIAMNGPTFSNLVYNIRIDEHTMAVGPVEAIKTAWNDALALNYTGAANDDFIISGSVETTAAGTLVLRWAQRVSNAAATTVKRGSALRAQRLA